jgi:hypothetical protein
MFAYQRHSVAFARHNERPSAALHLAGDNHHLALAGLLLSETAVFAIGLPVLWLHVSAEIGPINLNRC